MSTGIDVDTAQLERFQKRLLRLSSLQFSNLLASIGAVVESQTRNRIQNTKTAPDGSRWADWSPGYAGSKHGAGNHTAHPGQLSSSQGHTLLSLSGGLYDSIQWLVSGSDEVEVGSNVVYAGPQNKARQLLGLSSDNESEVMELIDGYLDREIGKS